MRQWMEIQVPVICQQQHVADDVLAFKSENKLVLAEYTTGVFLTQNNTGHEFSCMS